MSLFIQGTENVGTLTKDSSSIEQIVVEQYEAIKSRVFVQISSDEPGVEVDLDADCSSFNEVEAGAICHNVTQEELVHFKASFRLDESACTGEKRFEEKRVVFSLYGLDDAKLEVQVKCEECDCADQTTEAFSSACSNKGSLMCGGCECGPNRAGKSCECSKDEEDEDGDAAARSCRRTSSSAVCGGRGDCKCGQCNCEPRYHGQFCGCQRKCPKDSTGGECGRGQCVCDEDALESKCKCEEGWTGDDCSCPPEKDWDKMCTDTRTGSKCFRRGSCHCGR